MTYRAKMQDGKVVFEGGIKPADGVELRVDVVETASEREARRAAGGAQTLSEFLLSRAGIIDDLSLPEDGSLQVDHYVYGTPKR